MSRRKQPASKPGASPALPPPPAPGKPARVEPSPEAIVIPPEAVRYVEVSSGAGLVSGRYDPSDYWRLLRSRRGTILWFLAIGTLTGYVAELAQTPMYETHVSVEIRPGGDRYLQSETGTTPSPSLNTQVKILQSRSMRARAVDELAQKEQPHNVSYRSSPLAEWLTRAGVHLRTAKAPTYRQSLEMAAASVKVRSTEEVVDITCDSHDPQIAANYADTLVNEYIKRTLEQRWNFNQQANQWLTKQIESLKKRLEESEHSLQDYAKSANLLFMSDKDSIGEDKLRFMQQQLSSVQAERVMKQSRYEMAKALPPESVTNAVTDGTADAYESKITDLRRQLAELSLSYTADHYKVKDVQSQISFLETALKDRRVNVLERLKTDYEEAARREQKLAADYVNQVGVATDQAQKAVHYGMLKREVEVNRGLYDTMLQRVKELGMTSAMSATNIRIIDPPVPPSAPFKPDALKGSAMGLLSGLLLCAGFIFIKEHIDNRVRAPGDGPSYLNVPELGVIPSASVEQGLEGSPLTTHVHGFWKKTVGGDTVLDPDKCNALVTWRRSKPSLLAESFRTTLASIMLSGHNGSVPRIVVVTSPRPAEGKSTVTANLGIALAEINRTVLLVDADMRKPGLHHAFQIENAAGLSDLLQKPGSEERLRSYVISTKVGGLSLLPAGPAPDNIAQLLFSSGLREFFELAGRSYDAILIDSPPMLEFSDARLLGHAAKGVILVLRAGYSDRGDAAAAMKRLAEDDTTVIGTILNDWDPKATGHGEYGSYYKHYARLAGKQPA